MTAQNACAEGHAPPPTEPMPATPQTTHALGAALATAGALSGVQKHNVMLPEAILLALLCDPAIHQGDGPVPEEAELRRALRGSDERGDADAWCLRAKQAYLRAWQRAWARERARPTSSIARALLDAVSKPRRFVPYLVSFGATLTVGDVLAGLEGSGAVVDAVLRRRALDPAEFDAEPPPPLVGYPAGLAADALVDVIALNDAVTPMPFVTHVFETHLGLSPLQALYFMHRVHECGRARVCSCARLVAEQRIDAIHDAARPQRFPLAFVYGPRG